MGKRNVPSQKHWYHNYRWRMFLGTEYCRNCGSTGTRDNRLTFGHIIARANGGGFNIRNVTVLCYDCNTDQDIETWPHLRSLWQEQQESAKFCCPVSSYKYLTFRGHLSYLPPGEDKTMSDPCVPCPCLCQHGTHDNGCQVPCWALREAERRAEEKTWEERRQAGPSPGV